MSDKIPDSQQKQDSPVGENELADKKFPVWLVRSYIFITTKIKGKKIKCSPDKKIIYPFDK